MGIMNLTPDSFSLDGCLQYGFNDLGFNLAFAHQLINDGADLLDVGGESSRPGAKRISSRQEIERIIPTVKKLAKQIRVPISIDTYKSDVAKEALDAGADIINNIRGTQLDKSLLQMVRNYGAAIILMHMRGDPRSMQKNTAYKDVILELISSLRNSLEICLAFGIKSDRIIIDPGIGFGKSAEQNLEIIRRLEEFKVLNQPILIGTSRKSFIGKILNNDVGDRLVGSLASVSASVINGADIVRVHDVRETKETIKILTAIKQ